MIRLDGLRGRWGAFSLELSLVVPAGSYTTLLGPSGCGKSLLLGTVAGLYRPEAGRVLLGGEDRTTAPPEERGVGFVFQRSSIFPHLSVRANVEFGLRVRRVPRQERRARVAELAELLGLEGLFGRPSATLSGGEAQRVAIARALAVRPPVMLLDEPLSLVDHNARLELQEQLRRLHHKLGFTALHVTHNREEAAALGGRCAVMLGGKLVQVGPSEEVLARPRCRFVARFLGLERGDLPAEPGCAESCLAGTGVCDRPWSAGPAEAATADQHGPEEDAR